MEGTPLHTFAGEIMKPSNSASLNPSQKKGIDYLFSQSRSGKLLPAKTVAKPSVARKKFLKSKRSSFEEVKLQSRIRTAKTALDFLDRKTLRLNLKAKPKLFVGYMPDKTEIAVQSPNQGFRTLYDKSKGFKPFFGFKGAFTMVEASYKSALNKWRRLGGIFWSPIWDVLLKNIATHGISDHAFKHMLRIREMGLSQWTNFGPAVRGFLNLHYSGWRFGLSSAW